MQKRRLVIRIEQMGQMPFAEDNDVVKASRRVEPTSLSA
jgi:hypothetical protein